MKRMKKSMFITTLIMIVVLIVALSTATFAWYTANTTVSVDTTVAQSATSNSAAIAVDTVAITANSTGVVASLSLSNAIAPMIPTENLSTSNALPVFKTAPVNSQNVFTTVPSNATPATISSVKIDGGNAVSQSYFYVGNTNKDRSPNVSVTVNILGSGYLVSNPSQETFEANETDYYTTTYNKTYTQCEDGDTFDGNATYYRLDNTIATYLRVAVYSEGVYIGTWALTNTDVAYGTIVQGEEGVVDDTNIFDYSAIASGTASANTIALTGVDSERITVYAWFDGCLLTATESNAYCTFNIAFAEAV